MCQVFVAVCDYEIVVTSRTRQSVCVCQVFVAVCDYEIVVTSRTRQIVCVRCLWLCTSTRLKTRMR